MGACLECPRNCRINRADGELGFCGVGDNFVVAKSMLHAWEEPCISGRGGAGTVFFSGCNLRCVYCQNCDISHGGIGKQMTDGELEAQIFSLVEQGAECIEFVTPTHYTSRLARLLERIKPKISVPVVWNSGGYEKVDSLRQLEGLVDIYLPDLKYFSSELAQKYSAAPDYCEIALAAIEEMIRQVGKPQFSLGCGDPNEKGMLKRGVIVRHLVLPSHRQDSIELLKLFAKRVGTDSVLLSLMSQYTPEFYLKSVNSSSDSPLCRKLTSFEYNSVARVALNLGFDGYFQDKSSASSSFTPDFS